MNGEQSGWRFSGVSRKSRIAVGQCLRLTLYDFETAFTAARKLHICHILYNKTLKVGVRLLEKSFQRLFFVLPDDLRGSDLA